jgi:hypothetical protein
MERTAECHCGSLRAIAAGGHGTVERDRLADLATDIL